MLNKEDAILKTPVVKQIEVGRFRAVENETTFWFVDVYGNDELGYIASFNEYLSDEESGYKPEFYEVNFQTSIYPTADEAIADAMPSATKEVATILARLEQVKPDVMLEQLKLNPADYEITNGYIGSLGVTYETATEESLNEAIESAAQRNNVSTYAIAELLVAGNKIEWCDSPNYYYDHGAGIIRRKRNTVPVKLVDCDCGHSVPRSQVMSASLGTSCFDCYDRMSG